ncbi:DUF4124 domain-containing protein [Pseudomonas sp. R5(2019)]|uniref:DUF4124 domain-containing protein n=1 Tax=Pseudomonas sp. R5(2019) TaxID=2697566 RepID=UPI001413396B|nr:DUF4124 domain-containing protein [Pseudomonas sp. R5(2019)]NBA98210.1 DUF4124 domain-containing protein [Pseudomonas sp. R5(2019)]
MHLLALTTCWLLALSAPAMAAQVYKWVDAQGVTHFDAQPPQGQDAVQLDTPPPPRPGSTTPRSPPANQGAAQQRAIDAKVRAQVNADQARLDEYCERMRTNLAQLKINPRVREKVEGGVRPLSEDDRQARITEMQQAIMQNCE